MSIPPSFIQELLARTDIVDVVGRYVQLKKTGANYVGLCPFHGEKTPSFSVSPSKQFYHCFGCGANGDAIHFLTEYTNAPFVEAVHDLAQQAGLQVPQDDHHSPQERERAAQQRVRQATLSDVLEKAAVAYRQHLKTAAHAIAYLKNRGISGAIARDFGLGYAPQGWRTLASVFPDYNDTRLVEAGLVVVHEDEDRRYDRFRDRVIFPIRNVKGECIGFGGRVLGDEKPKYLNSPETPVFSKGHELYGLFEARGALRTHGYALVTEGYMDVVALAQMGFPNAVATLGTACTAEHIHKLFRFTDSIVFSFDGDDAGRRAAYKALVSALPYASDTRSIKFLFLPPEHDPDSYIRAFGADAFARFVGESIPLSRFLISSTREGCDLGSAEGRAHMASNAKPLWSALPNGALARQLLAEIAECTQLGTHELLDLWKLNKPATPSRGASHQSPYPAKKARDARPSSMAPHFNTSAATSLRALRSGPTSRADHAARLLLSHMEFFSHLSPEDFSTLASQPAPHGTLFVWLEGRFHNFGVQSWAVLREALREHECAEMADRLMSGAHAQTEDEVQDLLAELRDLLNRMLAEHLKAQESAALATLSSDPTAQERYRQIKKRRASLLQQSNNATNDKN